MEIDNLSEQYFEPTNQQQDSHHQQLITKEYQCTNAINNNTNLFPTTRYYMLTNRLVIQLQTSDNAQNEQKLYEQSVENFNLK
ncbi:MAG: hypothetical protein JO327_11270 [Nitrososphaeraceae archaeon]|nr:hypothetical protein [Nitrososphaeraceae archaeon]MBV9668695.1 hypothetical protein [Nitrososphaeraceae archaeon]